MLAELTTKAKKYYVLADFPPQAVEDGKNMHIEETYTNCNAPEELLREVPLRFPSTDTGILRHARGDEMYKAGADTMGHHRITAYEELAAKKRWPWNQVWNFMALEEGRT